MLKSLSIKNVGPAPHLELEPAVRLNLFTGDNGLGKSFLLDVIWWVLTRQWPHDLNPKLNSGYPARPQDLSLEAEISFTLKGKSKTSAYTSSYNASKEEWSAKAGRPMMPGLVLYAHVDGGFSVWDPARNYWRDKKGLDYDFYPGFSFSQREVWDGLFIDKDGQSVTVCQGLLLDWARWVDSNKDKDVAQLMERLLEVMSPPHEPIKAGRPRPISALDVREIPTIQTPYAQDVSVLHVSSGMRRIIALAYMLTWTWRSHLSASKTRNESTTSSVVMLVDEIESHLHPRWQRSILRSLLTVAQKLQENISVQLFVATHSPLVMASAEPLFDPEQDAWFDFDLSTEQRPAQVSLHKRDFVRKGTAGKWLLSEAFDLMTEGRAPEVEALMLDAELLLKRFHQGSPIEDEELERLDHAFRQVLGDIDPFWIRWSQFKEVVKHASPIISP